MDDIKYKDFLERSQRLIYKAGWRKWQEFIQGNMNSNDTSIIEKTITLMELLEEHGVGVAATYLNGESDSKEYKNQILTGIIRFSKKGPSFVIYFIDKYGSRKIPDDVRSKYEAMQRDYDQLGAAEEKQRRKAELEGKLAGLQAEFARIREQIEQTRRELGEIEGK